MTLVHWTQPGLEALVEGDGHGDTCGPIVILDYVHVLHNIPLSYLQTDSVRTSLLHAGLFEAGQGMTLPNIVTALDTLYGVQAIYQEYWDTVQPAELHYRIHATSLAKLPMILETSNAAALPGNQPGVQNHFVLCWGIDSVLGYYTCNGDTVAGLRNGPITEPVWYTWANLDGAQIRAYAILPGADVV
jgi:hypothetical protein